MVDHGGNRIAGNCYGLHPFFFQKVQALLGQMYDILSGTVSVWIVLAIAEIDDILLRKNFLQFLYHGEAAETAVHYSDRRFSIYYDPLLSKYPYYFLRIHRCGMQSHPPSRFSNGRI